MCTFCKELCLQGETCIAMNDLDRCRALGEIAKVMIIPGNADDIRIDLVEGKPIAGATVGRQRANPQADDADVHRIAPRRVAEQEADRRGASEVRGRRLAQPGTGELFTVHDGPIP